MYKLLAALLLVLPLASSSDRYRPRTPRFYNWLEQQGEYLDYPIIGDDEYPQQYPEMGAGADYPSFYAQQQYDPLAQYPYVDDPNELSSRQVVHQGQQSNPAERYPYVDDPYEGDGPQFYSQQQLRTLERYRHLGKPIHRHHLRH